jgi:hypothetical protein
MKKKIALLILVLACHFYIQAQDNIPLDTTNWEIRAKAYVLENFQGSDAIYLQAGSMVLKDHSFLNGTIEFDIFLKEEQAFPGVYFRFQDNNDGEQFFLRPHLSGKPDANQAAPTVQGITPWQLYFGPRYSFAYEYNYGDWTHVKIKVNGDRAQVFLDYSEKPNLSWNLFHNAKAGKLGLTGGRASGMHLANIKINNMEPELTDFNPIERKPIEGLIPKWEVSDMFLESILDRPESIDSLLSTRRWIGNIEVEEGTAANISRKIMLYNGEPGNTVFARIEITSDRDQLKLLDFGYSDRVVVILNGKPIYRGNNKWRSRDYRYLGTVGLFDAVYLNLKKGKNTLLMAVSEDFGGWLVTAKIKDNTGINISPK